MQDNTRKIGEAAGCVNEGKSQMLWGSYQHLWFYSPPITAQLNLGGDKEKGESGSVDGIGHNGNRSLVCISPHKVTRTGVMYLPTSCPQLWSWGWCLHLPYGKLQMPPSLPIFLLGLPVNLGEAGKPWGHHQCFGSRRGTHIYRAKAAALLLHTLGMCHWELTCDHFK